MNDAVKAILPFVLGATLGLAYNVKKEEPPIKTIEQTIQNDGAINEGDIVEVLIGEQNGIVILKYRYQDRYDIRLFDGEWYYIETFNGYEIRKK